MPKLISSILYALACYLFIVAASFGGDTLAGSLTIQQWVKGAGHLAAPQLTANQNNYNPTGQGAVLVLRLTSDADRSVTGIVPTTSTMTTTPEGRFLFVYNVNSSAATITLVNSSASSTAANRFQVGADIVLTANGPGTLLQYDDTAHRWRCVGGTGSGGGGGGSGTVTSVDLDLPTSVFTLSGGPVTTSGTLTGTFKTQTAHFVFAGPTSGSAATPAFRALVATDIPDISTTYLTAATAASTYLTQTTAASTYQPLNAKLTAIGGLTNALGWLHNDGSGTFIYSTPTKSDVGLGNVANTAQVTAVTGSAPIVSSGGTTPQISMAKATASVDGYLSATDFGTFNSKGSGSVTSVGLILPSFLSVAGSPVTTSGSFTVTLATQSANLVFAGPASGSAAGPTFRSLVVLDIPTGLNQDTTGSAAKWTTARNLAGNSVDGSAAVAFANKFIVQGTTDTGLTGAQFLGSLGTGIVKNTTTTGVVSIAIAADFPTLNQNTTGSAATLTTPRAINGTNFDGSAAITVTADANTLTNTTLHSTVVASSLTSVGTIATGTWNATTIAVNKGGTGLASYAVGDLLQASASTTLSALAAVATGNVLISGGVTTVSSWGKVGLTTHVSGILPNANGGTGFATYAVGDLLYASTTSALSKLAAVATGQVLISQGTSTAPIWSGTLSVTGVVSTSVASSTPYASTSSGYTSDYRGIAITTAAGTDTAIFGQAGSTYTSLGLTAADTFIYAPNNFSVSVGATLRGRFTSAGLAVAGSVTTAAPSGGTSGAWKLGAVVTGVTATMVSTQYIQVDVGGTLYKLATVTAVP